MLGVHHTRRHFDDIARPKRLRHRAAGNCGFTVEHQREHVKVVTVLADHFAGFDDLDLRLEITLADQPCLEGGAIDRKRCSSGCGHHGGLLELATALALKWAV